MNFPGIVVEQNYLRYLAKSKVIQQFLLFMVMIVMYKILTSEIKEKYGFDAIAPE